MGLGTRSIIKRDKITEEKELIKSDDEEIKVTVVPVTDEEIAERIRNGNYEWTEYDADDVHEYDDYTIEELEAEMEKLRKELFGNRADKKQSVFILHKFKEEQKKVVLKIMIICLIAPIIIYLFPFLWF